MLDLGEMHEAPAVVSAPISLLVHLTDLGSTTEGMIDYYCIFLF